MVFVDFLTLRYLSHPPTSQRARYASLYTARAACWAKQSYRFVVCLSAECMSWTS